MIIWGKSRKCVKMSCRKLFSRSTKGLGRILFNKSLYFLREEKNEGKTKRKHNCRKSTLLELHMKFRETSWFLTSFERLSKGLGEHWLKSSTLQSKFSRSTKFRRQASKSRPEKLFKTSSRDSYDKTLADQQIFLKEKPHLGKLSASTHWRPQWVRSNPSPRLLMKTSLRNN